MVPSFRPRILESCGQFYLFSVMLQTTSSEYFWRWPLAVWEKSICFIFMLQFFGMVVCALLNVLVDVISFHGISILTTILGTFGSNIFIILTHLFISRRELWKQNQRWYNCFYSCFNCRSRKVLRGFKNTIENPLFWELEFALSPQGSSESRIQGGSIVFTSF